MAVVAAVVAVAAPVPQRWTAAGWLPFEEAVAVAVPAVAVVVVVAAGAWAWSAEVGEAAPSFHCKADTAEGTVAGHTQANHHHLAADHHSRILVEAHHSPYRIHHWSQEEEQYKRHIMTT